MKEKETRPKPAKIDKDEYTLAMFRAKDAYEKRMVSAQADAIRASLRIKQINATMQKVREAERGNLRVTYWKDEESGTVWMQVGQKEKMGFLGGDGIELEKPRGEND